MSGGFLSDSGGPVVDPREAAWRRRKAAELAKRHRRSFGDDDQPPVFRPFNAAASIRKAGGPR